MQDEPPGDSEGDAAKGAEDGQASEDEQASGDDTPSQSDPQGPRFVNGTFRVIEVQCCQRNFVLELDGTCRIESKDPWGDEQEEACTYDLHEGKVTVQGSDESLGLSYESDDLLRVGDQKAALRRVLEDGTVVDYPQVVSAKFMKGSTNTIYLRLDGTFTHEYIGENGGYGTRGVYDLWEGFSEMETGEFNTIILLEDGNLNMGTGVFDYRP